MKENVGELDRNMRFVAAGALLAVAFMSRTSSLVRVGALLFGMTELLTATTRYCPLSAVAGIDTNRGDTSMSPDELMSEAAAPITPVSDRAGA